MPLPRVLVAEPSAPICAALRKFLDGRAEVQAVHYLDEAVQTVRARPPDVVIASVSGTFDGEVLAVQLRKQHPDLCLVLVYPPEEEKAFDRATAVNADAFLTGPLKKSGVLNAVRAALKLRELRLKVLELAAKVEALEARPVPAAPSPRPKGPGVNTADETFFKKYMLLEVKRSKRYAYPVALLLVGLDRLDEHLAKESSPEFQRAAIRSEVLSAISALVRDIDVAMPFAEDKYLVFLPHTPHAGARIVAQRIVEKLSTIAAFEKGSASVGLAGFDPTVDPKASVSFGALVREASLALKRAQEAGGNRVDAPAGSTEGTPKPKKSRISMG
ncbi:MAG: response regulator [Myxococcaceae bacterium]|nr:response regulator [Myxococcaceae bacterium]